MLKTIVLPVLLLALAAAAVLAARRRPARPQTPPASDDRQALLAELTGCRREAAALRMNRAYAALFDRLAQPVQQLLGLGALASGAAAPDWATPDALHGVLADAVAGEIAYALRRSGAHLQNGMLTLPAPAQELDDPPPGPDWTAQDLRRAIRACRSDIAAARAWERQKQVCLALGGVLGQLPELAARPDYDAAAVCALAGQARAALEQGGLYPLFADDPRLAGSPVQRARFTRISDRLLEYPGLFLLEDGRPVQFGSHTGTCREGSV